MVMMVLSTTLCAFDVDLKPIVRWEGWWIQAFEEWILLADPITSFPNKKIKSIKYIYIYIYISN
jgi:hypothetical protein